MFDPESEQLDIVIEESDPPLVIKRIPPGTLMADLELGCPRLMGFVEDIREN
jgi:hypothetical protein